MLLVGRYKIVSKIQEYESQRKLLGLPIEKYRCKDELTNQDVIVLAYPYPEEKSLQNLALNIWEYDIRLSRKALSVSTSHNLIKLLDARYDETKGLLLTILENYEDTLASLLQINSSIFEKEMEARKRFWEMFLQIVYALDALHDSGLFHRNISPESIFLCDDDKSQLKLGNYSWGVYLHSLVRILSRSENGIQRKVWNIYCAPEIIPFDIADTKEKVGETFSSDLFSLGMVITHCLIGESFLSDIPTTQEIRYEQIEEIRREIGECQNFIILEEKQLLLNLTSITKSGRIKSTKKMIELITGILSKLIKSEDFEVQEKLPVSFDDRPGSFFWKDLEQLLDKNLVEIANNIDQFLEEEFKDTLIYPSLDKEYPLCIVSSNNICYEFQPKFNKWSNKENLTVARLKIPSFYFQEKILKAIRTEDPIAILKKGVYKTTTPNKIHSPSRWGELFSKGRSLLSEKILDPSAEVQNFIDRLFLILDAQKELESNIIVSFKRLEHKKMKERGVEKATIQVESEKDEFEKIDLGSYIRIIREKSLGNIELSRESSPYAEFDQTRVWKIESMDQKNQKITLKRKITKRGKVPPYFGYIRPLELSLGVFLHKRRRWGILDIKENRGLLDVLLFPKSSLINLGLPSKFNDPLITRIQNTIPMFLVQGPPGTGKTWLASNLVKSIYQREPSTRILLSAHDHEPLDNLLESTEEALRENKTNYPPIMIRLLSTDRELFYRSSEKESIALKYAPNRVTKEILKVVKTKLESNLITLDIDLRQKWTEEIEKNIKNPSFEWIDIIKRSSNIVFSTATSAGLRVLKRYAPPFDWTIVEEAGKAYITDLILPMNLGQRWVLIGDQRQLPPYKHREVNSIISEIIEDKDMLNNISAVEAEKFKERLFRETKFFDDLYSRFLNAGIFYLDDLTLRACERLNKQWRMPPKISDMISTIFYDDSIFEHEKEAPANNDPFEKPDFITVNELIWINTPYCTILREAEEVRHLNGGFENRYECKIIGKLLQEFKPNDEYPEIDLSILTPYKDQRNLLREQFANLETKIDSNSISSRCFTIDSYQGREADVIIISLVRNNDKEEIRSALGFTIEEERLNVLFSRSKKRLIIVGCMEQYEIFNEESQAKAINDIITYVRNCGKVIEAKDFM